MLYDAQGKEIPDAKTAEEVQAEIKKATEGIKTETEKTVNGLKTQLSDSQKKVAENEKLMETMSEKDENFKKLREENDKLKSGQGDIDKKISDAIKGFQVQTYDTTRKTLIAQLAGKDEELGKKLEIKYNQLIKLEENIDEDVMKRVLGDAYKLVADKVEPSLLSRVVSNKPTSVNSERADDQVDPEVAKWAPFFNLKIEDIKKFGKK